MYKGEQKYLGAIFTDNGSVKFDMDIFVKNKTKEVNVKLARYLTKNEIAPLPIKLKIVNACINSALLYSCESWGGSPLQSIEVLQRKALKMILDISKTTPNEILYIETGFSNLKPAIQKRQLKFFQKMKKDCEDNPTSPISVIFHQALTENIPFLRHYKNLEQIYVTPQQCFDVQIVEHKRKCTEKLIEKFETDPNSPLGTYYQINPECQVPEFALNISCSEFDRKTLSRYRTGCHKLKIQTGRYTNEGRDTRLCSCGADVQTLSHVLFSCPTTLDIRRSQNIQPTSLDTFFNDKNYIKTSSTLKAIAKKLKIDST